MMAQSTLGEWEALTSVIEFREVTFIEGNLYAATGGGIFEINNENEYHVHTTLDGIEGVDLSVIAVDFRSNLWIGGKSPFGFLQIYDAKNKQSIATFDFGLSEIIDIQFINETCWVLYRNGLEEGIMKFVYNNQWEYRDSYRNFLSSAGQINCFAISDSKVYLGMTNGLYSGNVVNNLKDPNNWVLELQDINMSVTSMQLVGKDLSFTTNDKIYDYDILAKELTEETNTIDFEILGNIFIHSMGKWFTDGYKIYFKNESENQLITDKYQVSNFIFKNEQLFACSKEGLIIIQENNSDFIVNRLIPNTPSTGNFSAIAVLNDGRLVGGSGNGISIYNGIGWRNILEIKTSGTLSIGDHSDFNYFIADTVGYDFGEYIADIEQGLMDSFIVQFEVLGSTQVILQDGAGVIIIDIDDPNNITTIDTTFLSYHTSSSNSIPYQVTVDIEFDNEGNFGLSIHIV